MRVSRAVIVAAETVVDSTVHLGRSIRNATTVDRDTALARLKKRGSEGHGGDKSEESKGELHSDWI